MIALPSFVLAVAALIARLILLVRLDLSGVRHPVRDAVSDYGVGNTRPQFEAMGAIVTVAWWLLALGTWFAYPNWSDRTYACATLAVIGATTAMMRFFPTDLVGDRITIRGRVHYVLAIVQFALAYSLMGNVVRLLGDGLSSALRIVAMASLIGVCLFLVPRLRSLGLFGLVERVFIVSGVCFYLNYALQTAVHTS